MGMPPLPNHGAEKYEYKYIAYPDLEASCADGKLAANLRLLSCSRVKPELGNPNHDIIP